VLIFTLKIFEIIKHKLMSIQTTVAIIGTGHIGRAIATNLSKAGRPYEAIKEFFAEYGEQLQDKIIVDPSNPIAQDGAGGFKKIIDANLSAGQLNATALPAKAKLVKALGTLGESSLLSAAFQQPEQAVLFYANDDQGTDGDIEQLIRDTGFEPLRVGDINQSIRLEVFGDLHEFGALGKTVTLKEAKSKI
jgi:predicted dinucleotide-binding enzyme